jgi:pyruvate,water dikinase
MLRQTYDSFKTLLEQDGISHDLMAEFEVLYHDGKRVDYAAISKKYEAFSHAVASMVKSLEQMNPSDADTLFAYFQKFDFYIRFLLAPPEYFCIPPFVISLETTPDPTLTGNKTHNLAVLKNILNAPVPEGFAITTNAFYTLIEHNQLREPVDSLLATLDIENQQSLQEVSGQLVALVRAAEIPPRVGAEIVAAYDQMEQAAGEPVCTAVRSSAVSEDGENSFAGQYHTELGATRETIFASYLEVLASKYTPEALFYRITVGLGDEETPLAVLVLPMVEADKSGVVYTVDPTCTDEEDQLAVHSIHGLGELLVSGASNADVYVFNKKTRRLENRKKGIQKAKLVLERGILREQKIEQLQLESFSLADAQAEELAEWGRKIENHYGCPQDIEWAITADNTLYLLQARPLHRQTAVQKKNEMHLPENLVPVLETGKKAAGGAACGNVHLAVGHDIEAVEQGAILVTRSTPPSLVRIINRLGGVVAEKGSAAGHFATVCREFGVPLLVSAENCTSLLEHGQEVTLDADQGMIYPGRVEQLLDFAPCGKDIRQLPYFKKLKSILGFITPLKLINPASPDFQPSSCRSMHDIIRYTHEQAVQAMFSLGDKISGKAGKCRKLHTDLPLEVYILDVGGGICEEGAAGERVEIASICSPPFIALWKGLSHPGVDWEVHSHFDWKSFDDIALAGGVATKGSADFASYAIISDDYLNLNMRFGYHFTLVDAHCSEDVRTNYCQLRFAGGGGDYIGKTLRLEFLVKVLEQLGLSTNVRADLLDAKIDDIPCGELCETIEILGRLLGATKLMDMVLKQGREVEYYVEQFFAGKYNFTQ